MQAEATKNPADFKNILSLGSLYAQMQDTNHAYELFRLASAFFEQELTNANARPENLAAMAQICVALGNVPMLETTLNKLIVLQPDQPEPRYDLAALEAITGKTNEALKNLALSLGASAKRRLSNPAARDLVSEARNDVRFNSIRNEPEFQKLVPAN